MKELLALNGYFLRYKKEFLVGTLFLTASNAFLVWVPVLIRKAMNRLEVLAAEQGIPQGEAFALLFDPQYALELIEYPIYLVLASVLYGGLLFGTRQYLIVASRRIEYDMRNELFGHLQKLPRSYYARTNSGDIYVRATEDINRVRDYFGPAYMYMVNTFTRAGIIIVMMLMVNVELTLWALLPLPFLAVMAYKVSTRINILSTRIQEQYALLAGRAQEAFSSIRLIKAYVKEEHEANRFEHEARAYRKMKLRLGMVESLFYPMLTLLIGISSLFVIWKGGVLVIDGVITVGNIAEYVIYVTYLTWPIASLGFTLNMLQRSAASQKRLASLYAEPVQHDPAEQGSTAPEGFDLTFKNVFFRYPGAREDALSDINLTISQGSKVAFVGKTGSGKTTLLQLIPRLLEPDSGTILLGDTDISKLSLNELRSRIGYVPQESFLFSDTIGGNIAFGTLNADQQRIEDAAGDAQLIEAVERFDKKFMTMIGERGITLSGGQKQRTSIARALIKKPQILILDDSMSAVDSRTEDALTQVLRDGFADATTIMVAHRLSTVAHCDQIYVLDEGKIVEHGTHQELLTEEGAYASMYKKQLIEQELAAL